MVRCEDRIYWDCGTVTGTSRRPKAGFLGKPRAPALGTLICARFT